MEIERDAVDIILDLGFLLFGCICFIIISHLMLVNWADKKKHDGKLKKISIPFVEWQSNAHFPVQQILCRINICI